MKISEARKYHLGILAKDLGITFNNLDYLHIALTHKSYAHEREQKEHNERLEFLGDAVLELASSTYLFKKFPDMSEGNMTKARASVVCEESLAKIAKQYKIGSYLLISKGEELNGGRNRASVLSDAVEAIIGAVYLDRGWEAALDFVVSKLKNKIDNVENGANFKDYKSILQEIVQAQGGKIEYRLLKQEGPPHLPTFTVDVNINNKQYGLGKGSSKKLAHQIAAKEALRKLEEE